MRYSKAPSNRQLKVSEELKKQVSALLLKGDLYHPIIEDVIISITEVRISPDLRIATIFFTHMGGDAKKILQLFNASSSHIRHILAKSINLRFMPELRFVHDDSINNAVKIQGLIKT